MEPLPNESAPRPFDLSGGHPALDLVNSLDNRFGPDGPRELLGDYGDLLRFAGQARLLEPQAAGRLAKSVTPAAAARALRSARELREALARVLYGHLEGDIPNRADLLVLERRINEANRRRELHWTQASPGAPGQAALHWQWGRSAAAAEFPVWVIAVAAAPLLLTDTLQRVRACGAQNCRWLFLDTSKNHTRRWCNMKVCGNRAKARRFQERRTQ
ncbi:MAG: CGNR zinc finger domain-containing protein [Proteobacteria bacterium]|nr:CGNR zinc finger domain-containing protein [Pseudomonadota bacterium]